MSIKSLRRTGSCRFLIALLALASWPDAAATQHDSAGAAPLHAHMKRKEQALEKTKPFNGGLKRFRPDDELLEFLKGL